MENSELNSIARNLRKHWHAQEQTLIDESLEFSRSNLSLIEMVNNISNAGYLIDVELEESKHSGHISKIGKNFFTIKDLESLISTCFILGTNNTIEQINIGQRSTITVEPVLVEHSYIDEIHNLIQDQEINISSINSQSISQTINIFKDFIELPEPTNPSTKLVNSGSRLIPFEKVNFLSYI